MSWKKVSICWKSFRPLFPSVVSFIWFRPIKYPVSTVLILLILSFFCLQDLFLSYCRTVEVFVHFLGKHFFGLYVHFHLPHINVWLHSTYSLYLNWPLPGWKKATKFFPNDRRTNYRFPSLFAVDTFRYFGPQILNSQIKVYFWQKNESFWPFLPIRTSKVSDKKSTNNGGRLYT
jgi:hypothetical protein